MTFYQILHLDVHSKTETIVLILTKLNAHFNIQMWDVIMHEASYLKMVHVKCETSSFLTDSASSFQQKRKLTFMEYIYTVFFVFILLGALDFPQILEFYNTTSFSSWVY